MENTLEAIGTNNLLLIFSAIAITGIVLGKLSEVLKVPDVILSSMETKIILSSLTDRTVSTSSQSSCKLEPSILTLTRVETSLM